MKGITPPPFLDRHGVKPGEVVYVCPTVTCRQPHETREEYLAHWDTVHRQLDRPRPTDTPGVATRVAGYVAHLSAEQAENLIRWPELLASLVDQIRFGLDQQAEKMNGTPGEFIEVRVIAERVVVIEEVVDAQG